MSARRVALVGEPVLRRLATSVSVPLSAGVQTLVRDLEETVASGYDWTTVGIAAPQVSESQSLFMIREPSREALGKWITIVNPRVLDYGKDVCVMEEACVSVPGVSGLIARPESVEVEYYCPEAEQVTRKHFSDVLARVFLHEYDHLHGILFTDRVRNPTALFKDQERGEDPKALVAHKNQVAQVILDEYVKHGFVQGLV